MWRLRRKIVRMLVALVLTAALGRTERYGLKDTAHGDTQARECCDGPQATYSPAEATVLNIVALYAGDDGRVIRYKANGQTAVDVAGLNEPLVLFTCGVGVFLLATVFKRKFVNSIPSESVSVDLSSPESQSANLEPVIATRGEQWGPGGRGAL